MKKILIGKVVSIKMTKTVVVLVERKFRHAVYHKVIIRHKKFKAHNEKLNLQLGDLVKIEETKPISKDKHFVVIEKL
ncbi:MAG: ribosomal protein S17 [Candidatus Roizmanbacteria bacterium GW2011_GWA2_33_33]|uniref:Small ribosomal subunit protein uS17 n=2 Tax=Candidatus Roizmaniibacteriota TaxID=1752723 RepID=A0A0G0B0V4_9BACT|nr:MAG: ribosomal protein S17 [Candidatus Roizmanbacteria bacterium GW2011_GWA2_33_33]KKP63068.1 MAG: ribosomal protein S17 [Candidatus Roizmanbacteria bacterium GW2011_GWC2_34_23]